MILYLFTSSFPYGIGEGFLEDEIDILASAFDHIVIVPMFVRSNTPPRSVPANVCVVNPIMSRRTKGNLSGIFCVQSFHPFVKDFIKNKVYKSKRRFKAWLSEYLHVNIILNSRTIHSLKKNLREEDIVYTYWGRDAYALSLFWKGKCKFVSRFHGSTDLWEENSDNYKPLRHQIIKHLNLSLSISEKGRTFLDTKYPGGHITVGRLGNRDYGVAKKSSDGILRVLSCSNIIPLKRVELIFRSLSVIKNREIEWTHIGTGPLEKRLKEIVSESCNSSIKVNLVGQVAHDDVMKFYLEHPIDVFVNLSTIEGIPVTIMEAISFDVPVVATDVGATSEIVNENTGVLLPANPDCSEVAESIIAVTEREIHPRLFWSEMYDSKKNYLELVTLMKNL